VIWAAICGQFKSSLVIWDRKHGTINSKTFVEHILPVCKLCPKPHQNHCDRPYTTFGRTATKTMSQSALSANNASYKWIKPQLRTLNSPEPLSPIWDWSCLTGLATHLTSILLKVFGHCSKNASTSYVRSHTLESRSRRLFRRSGTL